MSALPNYEVYAIRYATRAAKRSENFIGGDPHDGPMPLDYYVWAAIGPDRSYIIDTGFTLRYLLQTLSGRAPNSLAVCTFLDRTSRRIVQSPVDFRCFEIPDRFVVGFGLDYNQLYRNLAYVAVLKPDKAGE